ncbi:MAG: leucyl aminopeptidase [Wenzhouxiangellaceae bacterium]|jgi:leucyl aminopeptidase|nr:leucyl aminopeptidase [Wenzhouxiangellaceae bacterium]MBS3745836.1 leucyl aminopeptidase [Wenzhouxiangellaceae bacterium]MBS3824259.1 leucyl aminopeptidase [Wenzhouxiangellaceae bacterium]
MDIQTIKFQTTDRSSADIETGCLIIGLFSDQSATEQAAHMEDARRDLLAELDTEGELALGAGKTLMIHRPDGLKARRLLVVGLGKSEKFDAAAFVKAARAAGAALRSSRATDAVCLLTEIRLEGRDAAWKASRTALALDHADYIYSATKKPDSNAPPATGRVAFPAADGVQEALEQAACIAAGIRRCRLLGDLPPNICTPAHLADTAQKLADEIEGLEVEVLEDGQMERLGMRSLLAVAQGSANRPRLIRLRWRGGSADQAPAALVGKGVTFDTGGISIKPRDLMEQMKFDMCGAATAIGVIEAIARLKLPINVDTVVAAVENMPDGKAYRPGDVIETMSGKTVEVHNTDAEGRMILADALTWTARESRPEVMVDIATLTGACVVALGHHASAVMTHDDDLAGELLAAGTESVDRAWRLPLWNDYQEQIETPFADMKNVGGMAAGSITAGCFLARFAEGQRWAHLDIAGSAWVWGKAESASGRPVGMLTQWLMTRAGG